MKIKKIVSLFLVITFFLGLKAQEVFSFDCQSYKNTCPQESVIPQIKKDCKTDVLNSVYEACERQNKDAQAKLAELSRKKQEIEKQESGINWYLSNLNYEIQQINSQVITIEEKLDNINKDLEEIDKLIKNKQLILSATIRKVYEYDSSLYFSILIGGGKISDFAEVISDIEAIQKTLNYSLKQIIQAKENLKQKKQELLEQKKIQELARLELSSKKDQQEYLLSQLKEVKTPIEKEMARLNSEIRVLKNSMAMIQQYLSIWLIGERPTWAQIFSAVNNASSNTGVRPALLLAVLEIESRYGTGLGVAGKYEEYCDWGWGGKTNLEVLLEICKKYGYDPAKVPMSSACAVGPAQFVPLTWVGYMGYKNPWNLFDAVLGMAVYLKANGAASGNEEGAVYRYNHSQSYVDSVMSRAQTWQSVINVCGLDLECPKMREKLEASGIPLR
jgi:membrane-bound lytic murein transglycosylase B